MTSAKISDLKKTKHVIVDWNVTPTVVGVSPVNTISPYATYNETTGEFAYTGNGAVSGGEMGIVLFDAVTDFSVPTVTRKTKLTFADTDISAGVTIAFGFIESSVAALDLTNPADYATMSAIIQEIISSVTNDTTPDFSAITGFTTLTDFTTIILNGNGVNMDFLAGEWNGTTASTDSSFFSSYDTSNYIECYVGTADLTPIGQDAVAGIMQAFLNNTENKEVIIIQDGTMWSKTMVPFAVIYHVSSAAAVSVLIQPDEAQDNWTTPNDYAVLFGAPSGAYDFALELPIPSSFTGGITTQATFPIGVSTEVLYRAVVDVGYSGNTPAPYGITVEPDSVVVIDDITEGSESFNVLSFVSEPVPTIATDVSYTDTYSLTAINVQSVVDKLASDLYVNFNSGTGFDGTVDNTAIQSDGKILVGGDFTTYNGVACPAGLIRLNADGTLDTTFNTGGAGFDNTVDNTAIQSDGKILVGGDFTTYNGVACPAGLVRLNTYGTLDTTFNTGGTGFDGTVDNTAIQSDGKILVGGYFTTYNGVACPARLVRLNTDGTLDTTFNTGGTGFDGTVLTTAIQSDGKILVGGYFTTYRGVNCPAKLARLNTDGTLDLTPVATSADVVFDSLQAHEDSTNVVHSASVVSYVDPYGVLASTNLNEGMDALVDTLYGGFNVGGNGFVYSTSVPGGNTQINSIAIDASGSIHAVGAFIGYNEFPPSTFHTIRLNTKGTKDSTWVSPFSQYSATLTSVIVQPDSKILLAGVFSLPTACIERFNSDSTTDSSFNAAGFNAQVDTLSLQSDGKIIVGGQFSGLYGGGYCPAYLVRLNTDGTLDTTFNTGGAGFNYTVLTTAIQSDGKIIVGGDFSEYNGVACPADLVRLNTDGTLDSINLTSKVEDIIAPPTGVIYYNFSAAVGHEYFINTRTYSTAITASLPAYPHVGDTCIFIDVGNDLATYPLTLHRNGSFINGTGGDFTVTTSGAFVTVKYVNNTLGWIVKVV